MAFMKAFTFSGKNTARRAIDAIEDQHGYIWIDDVAVLSRGKLGLVRVDSTWAQSDTAAGGSTVRGAILGALLGAALGPKGALARSALIGAVGGGSVFSLINLGAQGAIADPFLEQLGTRLEKDTSALILIGDETATTEFVTAFAPLDGELIETTLDDEDLKKIEDALKQPQGM